MSKVHPDSEAIAAAVANGGAPRSPPGRRLGVDRRRGFALLLTLIACGLALDAGYIHAKAALAQVLLSQAWEATRSDGGAHRPWPWADSHPVARLRMPRLGVNQIVLAGDSGRTIAFGPGWAEASAPPGSAGTTVISAHRDTHFVWLRDLQPGDLLLLESAAGERRYLVRTGEVADSRQQRLPLDADAERLLLVTCWPFDALTSGGPLRFVIVAEAVVDAQADTSSPTSGA